jgi:Mrp family chromosome partitioning ATPase
VIIDTPPLLGIADARVLAKFGDAVLLIIRWNSTAGNAVHSALTMLQMDEAAVVGAVFEMVDRSAEAIGGYYYSRKYGAYYEG